MIDRDLLPVFRDSLRRYEQMLFVSGPRQAGKTTLAKMLLREFPAGRYWSFDIPGDRLLLIQKPRFFEEIDRDRTVKPLVVLDEIHKYPRWKAYLKGAFDLARGEFGFLVTGSGRLDLGRRGGESLSGRYFSHHLFPLTIGELTGDRPALKDFLAHPDELPEEVGGSWPLWQGLGRLSGFPEPFSRGEETFYRRWAGPYHRQLVREDVRDLTGIRDIARLEMLAALLPGKVGGLLSLNSLREDLQVAHETVGSWIETLAAFYLVFLVRPWSRKITRAIRKEPKLYFFDWAAVADPSARFENMVAVHLKKAVSDWTERGEGSFDLHFARDRSKAEVDFVLSRDGKPILLVETKIEETEPAKSLVKMKMALSAPAVQLVNRPGISRKVTAGGERILVVSADRWLSRLP